MVFDPEATPPFLLEEIESANFPQDGQVITDRTYDQLKSEHLEKAHVR